MRIRQSAAYYREYLDKTVSLELPDAGLQQAYDWARISTIQGLVNNPYLGIGSGCGISHVRRHAASRLRVVLRTRFLVDVFRAQCGR